MSATSDSTLAGIRVLVVEDEALVAMLLEDMLEDLGCTVAAVASSVADGLAQAQAAEVDVAILDVNLAGQSSAPVAEALTARGKPFIFATGYGEAGVPEPFRGRPALQKPFGMNDVQRLLAEAVKR